MYVIWGVAALALPGPVLDGHAVLYLALKLQFKPGHQPGQKALGAGDAWCDTFHCVPSASALLQSSHPSPAAAFPSGGRKRMGGRELRFGFPVPHHHLLLSGGDSFPAAFVLVSGGSGAPELMFQCSAGPVAIRLSPPPLPLGTGWD